MIYAEERLGVEGSATPAINETIRAAQAHVLAD